MTHRTEGGPLQPLLRLGRVLDLLVADDRRARDPGCHPDQMGGTGRGDRARWAIRSPTRRARRTGWVGTTTSPVRAGLDLLVADDRGALPGAIRTKWAALGWETGPLGYPTTDRMASPDRVGRYNHFSGTGGASIFWSPKTGAHYVLGAIRAKWAALGWETGPLGYPTTDEHSVPVGRESDFRSGRLVWTARTGVVTG